MAGRPIAASICWYVEVNVAVETVQHRLKYDNDKTNVIHYI
ncbi:MAG: hypothetical protein PUG15_06670 [Bacteroidales bacterium]|nr:hypothetical protein [Bacteroidales bacterium]